MKTHHNQLEAHQTACEQLWSWSGYSEMPGYEPLESSWAAWWHGYFQRNQQELTRIQINEGRLLREHIDFDEAAKDCPWAFNYGFLDSEAEHSVACYLRLRLGVEEWW